MQICFVSESFFPPDIGGAEISTSLLAQGLAENDIKSQIDKNLKKLFESEIFEFYEKFKIENSELLKYIKFEFNNFNFIINQYTKDNYWQYLVLYDNGQTRYFYRYYIYLSISYSNYIELRNAFIQKIYNQKSNERDVLDLLIEFLKEKV